MKRFLSVALAGMLLGVSGGGSVEYGGAPLGAIVAELAHTLNENIVVSPSIASIPISIRLTDMSPAAVLHAVENDAGAVEVQQDGYVMLVPTSEAMRYSNDLTQVFDVPSGNSVALAPLMQKVLGGSVSVQPISGHTIVVSGLLRHDQSVQALIDKLDAAGVGVERVPSTERTASDIVKSLEALNAVPTLASVVAEGDDGAIILRGSQSDRDALRSEIQRLDIAPAAVRFTIDAIDVTPENFNQIRGVLFGQLQAAQTAGGVPTIIVGQTQTAFQSGYIPIAAQLNESISEGKSKLVKSTAVDAEQGDDLKVNLGEQVPVITQTSGLLQQTSVTYYPVGITLDVRPLVIDHDKVVSKIDVVDSDIISTNATTGAPTVASRSVVGGTYTIPSGQAVVMIGYGQDTEMETVTKVPVLGDLPILGGLFRQRQYQRQREHLVFVVHPEICPCNQSSVQAGGAN